MTFFKHHSPRVRPWPIHGLAYVIAFMGGIGGGACVGVVIRGALGLAIGLATGLALTFPFAWLSDRHIEPLAAKLSNRKHAVLIGNAIAFATAVALTLASMAVTLAILLNLRG